MIQNSVSLRDPTAWAAFFTISLLFSSTEIEMKAIYLELSKLLIGVCQFDQDCDYYGLSFCLF